MDSKIEKYIKENKLTPISINAPIKRSFWKEEYAGQSLKFEDLGIQEEELPIYRSYALDVPVEKKSGKMLAAAIIIYHKIKDDKEVKESIAFRKWSKIMVESYLKYTKATSDISLQSQRLQHLSQIATLLIYYRYVKKCIADSEKATQ